MPKTYTYEEVKNIIISVYEKHNIEQTDKYKEWFEQRLNDRGLNGNNGDNEDKEEYYYNDEIESFIY